MRLSNILMMALLIWSGTAQARLDTIPGSRYTSARSAALGDAYLPLGDDVPTGLFFNPAALGRMREGKLELINFTAYGNSGYFASVDGNFFNVQNLSAYSSKMAQHPGTPMGAGGSFVVSGGLGGFALGILSQAEMIGQQNLDGTLSARSLYQVIPAAGFGMKVFNGIIRIGASAQWVNQALGTQSNIASGSYSTNIAQGSGISVTAGMAVVAPVITLPSVNIVARNIGTTSYGPATIVPLAGSPTGAPPAEPMSFDASLSFQPALGKGVGMNLIFEDRDFLNVSNISILGHLAVGMELIFKNSFYLRGGWRGGYPSGGIGFKNKRAELALTYYTEELGSGFMSQGDTKYLLQYQLGSF